MKKALALILAAAMTCSLLLTGCGGGSGAGSASGSTAGSAAKQSLTLGTGGTIVLLIFGVGLIGEGLQRRDGEVA